MPILGAHMSIAGGFYKAVEAAARHGMDTVQIFTGSPSQWAIKPIKTAVEAECGSGGFLTKNNNQWRAKAISIAEAEAFREAVARTGVTHPLSHSSYLINLAAPDGELWEKSIAAMVVELERAEQFGIAYVVMHPGAYTTSSEEAGLARIAAALDEVHQRRPQAQTQVLLENTAGQGSNLGWKFEHLAAILAQVKSPERLGVCFDTCHAFAAGYPFSARRDYLATMKTFDQVVGLDRIRAFHLNDSKRELGSRVDRHEHIGRGQLGLEPFRHLLNDRRFRKVPMYLETPKEDLDGEPGDQVNLRTLRELVAKAK